VSGGPTIAAEGRDGQVVLRIGQDLYHLTAVHAYRAGVAILRAVSEADGVAKPRGYTEGAIVSSAAVAGSLDRDQRAA
jgi:hypothetical protein